MTPLRMRPVTGLDSYAHTESDAWRWRRADLSDVADIVALANLHYHSETDKVFRNDPEEYAWNCHLAIVSQLRNVLTELFSVARDPENNQLRAYTWVRRGERMPWSSEEMAAVRMAHVALLVSPRDRIRLLAQMLRMWEVWSQACGIHIICSTTVRGDQQAFLNLHHRAGYSVRGSVAFKRLTSQQLVVDHPGIDPI